MEFVGKIVKKDFKGLGVYTGVVQSYNASSGFFEIVYPDGDSEELQYSEVAPLVMGDGNDGAPTEPEEMHEKRRPGRKPKKRRRVETRAPLRENLASILPGSTKKETLENFGGDSNRDVDLNEGFVGSLRESGCVAGNLNETLEKENGPKGSLDLNGSVGMKDVIDLNSGFDLNLNVEFDSGSGHRVGSTNVGADNCCDGSSTKRECIDLNLDADCYADETVNVNCYDEKTQKRECGFDLNLGAEEEGNKYSVDGNCGGQPRESTPSQMGQETPIMVAPNGEESEGNRKINEAHMSGDLVEGNPKDTGVLFEDNSDGFHGVGLREGLSGSGTDGCLGDMESSYKQVSGRRKRRRVSDNLDCTAERVLRRSARRGGAKNHVLSTTTPFPVDDVAVSASPPDSALTEERPHRSGRKVPEEPVLAPKLQLPPSSHNVDLDGVSVLDVFSVYACLRSFSSLLFLSPFELEDFVAALKSKSPSSLFDCIHVSILQTLRKHLEYLSSEGSQSASDCLRGLNWALLDSITWPLFIVEYLLIHGSELKCGLDLTHLKLFRSDYYKQPASVKVEVLRCLCDDMIEVEPIRSELNRRSLASESDMDFDRNVNFEACRKRRAAMDVSGGSCLTEEAVDDTTDWNSDECCLCKMDGNLICCDGCPAAYHSKCVGVVNALLPEGEWYCPECVIDRHKPWMKPHKSPRGAELLGIDPHGRFYFSSCGYLLVIESCNSECSFNYYRRDDLNVVIDVLKSSEFSYSSIIEAIYKQWDISVGSNGASSNLDSLNSVCSDMLNKGQIPAVSTPLPPVASTEPCVIKNETIEGAIPDDKFVDENSGHLDVEASKSVNLLDSVPYVSYEGSAETTQVALGVNNFQKQQSVELSNQSETLGKSLPNGECSLASNRIDSKHSSKNIAPHNNSSSINRRVVDTSQIQCGTGYVNYYSFAQMAASVGEELIQKSSDKTSMDSLKSDEEIISTQMKAILKKSNKFHWSNLQYQYVDIWKEKCGWCFFCRSPTEGSDCLFNMHLGPFQDVSKSELVGSQSKLNKKGHIIDIICHILSIENRLQGLLLGPWLNPQYSKIWCKSALKASDVASAKHLLLMLEANLHPLALSSEWLKYADSSVTLGSASHIVTASTRASSKYGFARKRGRCSDFDVAGGLGICWWRGGKLSRQLFSWKVLPHALVSKAARQAGRAKIPGIQYPDNSDFAKRSKFVAWRAAVESSTSIEQLALQVRELDSNIRWDDIENTHAIPALDKEFKKSIRLFKKCIMRRKLLEKQGVKYLVDFGKRRTVPDIVLRHGTMVNESSSERKKYWLNESHVPLHLLKSFEEKRIARKSVKLNSENSSEASKGVRKFSKKRGFSYLFSKAERSEYHQCAHCNKDVPIREAVCCQYCDGFFHKRHVRKSAGAITAECKYTCHRCQDGKLKINAKRGKSDRKRGKVITKTVKQQPQKCKKASRTSNSVQLKEDKKPLAVRRSLRFKNNKKVATGVPLRRSSRKIKYVAVQNKKSGRCKKGKQKSKKKMTKKTKKGISWRKKRTRPYHTFWVNGLFFSGKPDDERVMQFQRKMFVALSEPLAVLDQPKCLLCCEAECTTRSSYLSCEICGEWFHGEAYGLNAENKTKLIGFRCHICLGRTPPICPHIVAKCNEESHLAGTQNTARIEYSEEVHNDFLLSSQISSEKESNLNGSVQGSFAADECLHKEQLDINMDTSQGPILEYKLESHGKLLDEKQNTDAQQMSNNDLRPDTLTSDENIFLEDRRIS